MPIAKENKPTRAILEECAFPVRTSRMTAGKRKDKVLMKKQQIQENQN